MMIIFPWTHLKCKFWNLYLLHLKYATLHILSTLFVELDYVKRGFRYNNHYALFIKDITWIDDLYIVYIAAVCKRGIKWKCTWIVWNPFDVHYFCFKWKQYFNGINIFLGLCFLFFIFFFFLKFFTLKEQKLQNIFCASV